MTREQIQQAWCTMIRGLITLSHTLPPLPANRYIAMRLFYYDDITPEDYEPPGFQEAKDAPDFEFIADAESVEIGGAVMTSHHGVSLRLDTAMPSLAGMDTVDPDVRKAARLCQDLTYITKGAIADVIGKPANSKHVSDVINQLASLGFVAETSGPRGRAVIHNKITDHKLAEFIGDDIE